MHPYVLCNDDIVRSDGRLLSLGQVGLLSGWGVFTTLRIYDGVPFAFDRHWQRLSRDARVLHVPLVQPPERVYANLLRLIDTNAATHAACRLCVVRNGGSYWAGPGNGHASDVLALTNDLQPQKESVSLSVAHDVRYTKYPFAGTKSLSWAHNLTLVEAARDEGFDEVILLNERGEVAECTSANLFVTKDGVTCTPPLSCGVAAGVTRGVLLEELELTDTPVAEQVLRLEDLYTADEVFITSTSRELLPVGRILDRTLANPAGGPIMRKLRSALATYVASYVEQQKVGI